jgi:uncharacterized 2Fe-2S/4Fe-4S cluster protein (DUF4445 family)
MAGCRCMHCACVVARLMRPEGHESDPALCLEGDSPILRTMRQVTILPGELVFHVQRGTPVRELLLREGILLDFPCGGRGLCNQCTVKIDPPTESGRGGRKPLAAEAVARGLRLACQAVVEGDCTVTIPEEKGIEVAWKDPAAVESSALMYGEKVIRRRRLQLPVPSLEDQRADWERLADALAAPADPAEAGGRDNPGAAGAPAAGAPAVSAPALDAPAAGSPAVSLPTVEPELVEGFARELRKGKWQVDALFEQDSLICLRAEPDQPVFGFAVDLGTTTVDVSLHNLETGRLLARKALLNRQTAFGADVISRTNSFQEKREEVRGAALETIADCAQLLLQEAGIQAEQVVRTTVVGNPIMIHILHGLNPLQLAMAPYIPLVSGMVRRPPEDFGWRFQRFGWVETLPLISAFVGADTVGMILALDLEHEEETTLSIDIGTNGEMVLSKGGELLSTSTAAGPAFEGAQIACGMRALEGAITGIAIRPDGELDLTVVGGGSPKGICGSGLIAGIAELLEAGLLDSSGRLSGPDEAACPQLAKRLFRQENILAFRLSEKVYITQKDIRELQLAKGAIRTGIDMMLEVTGVKPEELAHIRLAGNFGSGLDIRKTIRLGLIPGLPAEKVDVVGNAALRGAALALVSREYRQRAARVHRSCRFLELAARPDFQMHFASSLFF